MAVQTLRNYDSKHTLNDTINFWSNRPWKNPSVGKTSEREGVLLISSNLKITSAKINQQQLLISSLRFPCLKCTGRKPTTTTSKNMHTQPYHTDCTDFWKFVPRICCCCTVVVRSVRTIKCCLFPWKTCAVPPRTEIINVAAANPYRTDYLMLLAASKFVPSFALKIVPPLCCSFLFRKWKPFSYSCSLSISQSLQERMTSHLAFFLL